MRDSHKKISNPFSTGGGGHLFEAHIQALFVTLMLSDGFAPRCLPCWPIKKIKLQGKYAGFDTDDLIIYVEKDGGTEVAKLLAQIKHVVRFNKNDKIFGEVIQATWNDFNDQNIFRHGKDVLALITGPLSKDDTNSVRRLLEKARECADEKEFLDKIQLTDFSSDKERTILNAFRTQLKNANNGKEVDDRKLWEFLKQFYLWGVDLDVKAGITLALLHSLIGQYPETDAQSIWARILEEVQYANQNAGTITPESLPENIRAVFRKRLEEKIPSEISGGVPPTTIFNWNPAGNAAALAIAVLLGEWDDTKNEDKAMAAMLASEQYNHWVAKLREVLQQQESPVSLKNGIWTIPKRLEMWQTIGSWIFDDHLKLFKQCAINVLTERDPQFELPPAERYAAGLHGKTMKFSSKLRKGIAESLALLGNYPDVLTNCSSHKPEDTASQAIWEIFNEPDWVLWGSLNDLLPLLAEAAPETMLQIIDKTVQEKPCPFDELFSQEGNGITGKNYLTGLLWALESLAWDEKYLVQVIIILGELASRDPGGNWANRPANSLTTILLPWLPQTIANAEKRKIAIQTLQQENPDVAWKLLLSLLPNQRQASMGARKPTWRKIIPTDGVKGISTQEYWAQINDYANMTVEMAMSDFNKLRDLINHFDNLPQPYFEQLLEYLGSAEVTARSEEDRILLWDALTNISIKHKRFAGAEWSFNPELLQRIDQTANLLSPKNPFNLYKYLFKGRDYELFESSGNYQEQIIKLEERRQNAIREIIKTGGLNAVALFSEIAESPRNVGYSYGCVAEENVDTTILPTMIGTEKGNEFQFISGFIQGRYQSKGWPWVDNISFGNWTRTQIGQFLAFLEFSNEVWTRSKSLLGEDDIEYWNRVDVNVIPCPADEKLLLAIDKLIKYGKPIAAINCLYKFVFEKRPLDQKRAVKALLAAPSAHESNRALEPHWTMEIIGILQSDPGIDSDILSAIEWNYLPLLKRRGGASPKMLEHKLCSDPKFYCEIIRKIYRSRKKNKSKTKPTEEQKYIAERAYELLQEWQTPPGTQPDGSFSGEVFNKWVKSVREICTETGHLEVALTHLGNVLIYCPEEPDGFWINRVVAKTLNNKDSEEIRRGFSMGIFNSRGAHIINPSGIDERNLAEKYNKIAEVTEKSKYHRLANTLKQLAKTYIREAEWIVEENATD